MPNPFKPEDKVLTKIKGVEVEGAVRLVWNDEVQVRTSDGVLLWRTVKTVRPLAALGAEASQAVGGPTAEEPPPNADSVDMAAGKPDSTKPVSPPVEPEPANATDAAVPLAEGAESAAEPAPEVNPEPEAPSLVPTPSNSGGCGTAEEIVKQKRRRRR